MHATTRNRILTGVSSVLLAGGVFLLFQGARDLWDWRSGQSTAEEEFQEYTPPKAQPESPRYTRIPLGTTVARLSIPRLGTNLYVIEGVDAKDLRRAPGHMPGTALPGTDGNCVIAAHRDTHFRVLRNIQRGDEIVLETHTGTYRYKVDGTEIVSPTNTSVLKPTSSARLNLITCYPFYYLGHAPKRFIVHADMAETENASLPQADTPVTPHLLKSPVSQHRAHHPRSAAYVHHLRNLKIAAASADRSVRQY